MPNAAPPLWQHQRTALDLSRDKTWYALFMEQRTGKTRVVIETARHLWSKQLINAMLIVAPNGVHTNWMLEELPAWMGSTRYKDYLWLSERAKRDVEIRDKFLNDRTVPWLKVVAVNIEALRLDHCFTWLREFMKKHQVLMVVDEAIIIATPGAKQTKRTRALGNWAKYRRILDGTPATESPFQFYSPLAFLSPTITGISTYTGFKARYGKWTQGYGNGHQFPVLEEYINLEELQKKIKPHSFRVTRAECVDLPPKIYQKKFFDLSPVQRQVYDKMAHDYAIELDGVHTTVNEVMVRWMRLQQIGSNFYPETTALAPHPPCEGRGCDDCGMIGFIEATRPLEIIDKVYDRRLHAATELIGEELKKKGYILIWCRFIQDIETISKWAAGAEVPWVRYDGTVNASARVDALRLFQAEGKARLFLATDAAARGLKLSRATMSIFYSNGFSLGKRLQAEDRPESMDRGGNQIIDLIAKDTIDEVIVQAHREKKNISDIIMTGLQRSKQ